jgi:flavin-dependent dehydrogenase
MLECDVFVIGCGPAGASLAYYLTQKNIKVIVAEKKKNLDRPIRCAGLVSVNIAGLFDFKIRGINTQAEYLETYAAKNPSEKFHLISKTSAPGFILDRDTFINDIASRFTKAGGILLKSTKVISIQQCPDGFSLDLFDIGAKNHLRAKARIIAGADGPLSLIGRLTGAVNKSFMHAIQRNPSTILKSTDCNKIFFSPYISCGYGWLFPKTDSVNIGVGVSPERKKMHLGYSGFGQASGDSNNSGFSRNSGDSRPGLDIERANIPLKDILAFFTRHLEFSGIFDGNTNLHQSIFNNNSSIGENNKKKNKYQLLPAENKNDVKQNKSIETYKQFRPTVTGLIPDSGIVDNPGLKDGIILCGDAAGLCNPITGAGIYNAICSAKLASESIAKYLNLNDLNILQEIKEIYNSQFGNSINRALRKKLLQKNNWPRLIPDMNNWPEYIPNTRNGYGFDYKDTMKFSDLIRQTWISFRDYWR